MPKVSTIVRSLVLVAAIVTVSCAGDSPATAPTLLPAHGTPAKIELNATPGIGAHGGQAAVTARVLDAYALLLPDVDVTFSADAGAFDAATARTNGAGLATSVLKADPGIVKVRATAGGIQAPEAVVSIQPLNVFEPPPPSPPPPPPPPIPQPTPPQPSYGVTIVASPVSVVTGAPTTLSSTILQNFGAPAVTSWVWDCDTSIPTTDATTANTTTCTYTTAGTFTASVRVTGGSTVGFATTSVTVTVPPPVPPVPMVVAITPTPVATATIANTHVGDSVDFSATVSSTALPVSVNWEWDDDNDGTFETLPTAAPTPTNTRRVVMLVAGVWKVKVRVTDPATGRTAIATSQVTVLP